MVQRWEPQLVPGHFLEQNSCLIKKECINVSLRHGISHKLLPSTIFNGSACFLVTPTLIERSLLYFVIEHLHKTRKVGTVENVYPWPVFLDIPMQTTMQSTDCMEGMRCCSCISLRQRICSVNSQVPGHRQCINVQALTVLTGITLLTISDP